jgi:hypothetical protein
MVDMTVRVDVTDHFQLVAFHETGQLSLLFILVTGRVDEDCFPGAVFEEVTVDHEGIEDELFDVHLANIEQKYKLFNVRRDR